jgi:fucose permease
VLLLALAYLAFVSLGLPDAVLGILWPSLRRSFDLPQAALGMPLAAGAVTYFLSGLLAGRLTEKLGVGGLLALSTALVATGLAGLSLAPAFVVFLAGACVMGFGSGAVDSALNAYAAREFGPRHMTWLHASYSLGAALGPAIVTMLLARGAGFRSSYATLAAMLATLAVSFVLTRRRWRRSAGGSTASAAPTAGMGFQARDALRSPCVRLQALLFFVYTGVEVGAGQWSYTILTQARGVEPKIAGLCVTSYWTALLVGRVLSGFVVERVGTVRLLRLACVFAFGGTILFALPETTLAVSAFGLTLIGFALAPVFPGLMSETPRRVGASAAPHAIGFQVSAATAGVAILPNVGGLLTTHWGLNAVAVFIASITLALLWLHESLVKRTEDRVAGAR